ncbi:AAA family ATPase [Listeria booriae]|uniref:AAA family ATPase n=1 Tax=Listeria booriae TaxID=1552123 RepID=UPI0016250328|nr:AAA family ATPase [Listeria booriae]MBC2020805.1 AAA family ATPase [Listeria booriae]MBC2067747.1 AAA family ATPase [Listeria booriae]
MRPMKFRIKNYKSIEDSGECYFEQGYTVLAGKNECGKTTILEALRDFGIDKNIRGEAKPLNRGEVITEISIWFEVFKEELEEIAEESILEVKGLKVKNVIQVVKKSDEQNYVSNYDFDVLKKATLEEYCNENILPLVDPYFEDDDNIFQELVDENFDKWLDYFDKNWDGRNLLTVNDEDVELDDEDINVLKGITKIINRYEADEDGTTLFIDQLIEKRMPNFVFYSSFDDVFPDSISIDKIKTSEFAKDLEKISSFRIDDIINGNKQLQSNHQRGVNTEFTQIFKDYWTQDDIRLVIEKDGNDIYFWIEENKVLYKLSQRSKGQQWFLSFYIKVVARMQEELPNVILIDEPGLFLHAKAQKDMLKTLEQQFRENLIIFSTHSPYLIEENKLNHIRLIEKNNNTTLIHNKTWAKIQDKETLTPILTAIGLGLGDGINDRNKKNIICEGIEDVLYLRALKKILGISDDINFINGDGANKLHFIGRILEAWQCDVKYLLDNDNAGKKARKTLVEKELVDINNIFLVSDEENFATVDLLSTNNFKSYVIEDAIGEIHRNSEYISKNKLDKALLARKFLNNKSVDLDEVSIANIRGLFERLLN